MSLPSLQPSAFRKAPTGTSELQFYLVNLGRQDHAVSALEDPQRLGKKKSPCLQEAGLSVCLSVCVRHGEKRKQTTELRIARETLKTSSKQTCVSSPGISTPPPKTSTPPTTHSTPSHPNPNLRQQLLGRRYLRLSRIMMMVEGSSARFERACRRRRRLGRRLGT